MIELIITRSEFEPWWQLSGWEDDIVERQRFATRGEAEAALAARLAELRGAYANEACRDGTFYAFWNCEEAHYCDACDDALQIYHGAFLRAAPETDSAFTGREIRE